MKALGRVLLLAVGLLSMACDRRVEPYVPPDQEPPAPSRPVRIPGLEQQAPRDRQPALTPARSSIRGTIRLGSGVQVPNGGVLFLIARTGPGGPPLAVKRLPVGPFPMAFEIGPADVMLKGRPFEGPIQLSARVDQDGNTLTRDADDLVAQATGPLEPGAEGADLMLSRAGS